MKTLLEVPASRFYLICPVEGLQEFVQKDTYPDGRAFVGYGIKPDTEIAPALSDYLQQKDPVLAKAVGYFKRKIQ